MDACQTSLHLLAHVDGSHPAPLPTRGIPWVLQCVAAWGTLCVSAAVLADFGYSLAAELRVARAARAGALEATLPRATSQTIAHVIERRLAHNPALAQAVQITIQQNGVPVRGLLRVGEGDRLTVTLAAPAGAALPRWVRAVNFWRADSQILVRVERQIPRRYL